MNISSTADLPQEVFQRIMCFRCPMIGWNLYPQTLRRGDDVLFCCKGAVVTKAVVAYARDGNNAEVIFSENERLSGSAPVSNIEVVVSEKQANMLGKLADKGNKFVLLYAAGGDG